ncbi:MAG: zinc ribbon domain-containing protein [Eubacterium sp.]|nr:zinc ribbon domain-containing protein [Eubacterium sp.]
MGMVALKCPGCGADIELDDSREFGFCNYCGTKVMQDKIVVEHQGSVKVDNSEYVEKFLQNARRAKQKEDWEETEKYYNLVEQNDPSNIEAIFYSSYGKAKTSLVSSDLYKRQAAFKVLQNCVSIIDDNFDVDNEEEQKKIIEQISVDIMLIYGSQYVYNQKKNGYGMVVSSDQNQTITLFNNLAKEFMITLENIAKKIPDEQKEKRVYYYKLALSHAEWVLKNGKLINPKSFQDIAMQYHKIINELDPSHEIPEAPPEAPKSGGCYVATAVYGSYDCPQVWTLRRYRDNELAKTWYGRAFIHAYYAISPTIVKWFGETQWFKFMWKGKLDKMVENLQLKGYESTPYDDLDW